MEGSLAASFPVDAASFARARWRRLTSGVPEIRDFSAERTAIDGLWLISMKEVTDERGTVREFYRESAFLDAGLPSLGPWLQINVTETRTRALRGLHAEDMDKLVAVVAGEAFGAYVDTRRASPTYRTVVTVQLTKGTQVLVPRGVGNAFQVVSSEPAQYVYCFDHEWVPGMAGTAVNPLDPALGIEWPLPIDLDDPAQISAKDKAQPPLAEAN
jgi:dTDP-4-dehydrorhamnose 3,5-epimerase